MKKINYTSKEQLLTYHLLLDESATREYLIKLAALKNINFSNFAFVNVLDYRVKPSEEKTAQLRMLKKEFAYFCQLNCISRRIIVYNNMLLILCGADTEYAAKRNQEKMLAFVKELNKEWQNKLHLGCGSVGNDIMEYRTSYREALQAIKLLAHLKDLQTLAFKDLGLYGIILKIAEDPSAKQYYLNKIQPLLAYGKNDDRLTETLKTYLSTNNSSLHTAKSMHIHMNTVYFRLNKIKKMLGIDLENPCQCMEFLFALLLHDYLHNNLSYYPKFR